MMKPNKMGGQDFESHEIGTLRNLLWQAKTNVAAVPPESADGGHSPLYNSLAQQLGYCRPTHAEILGSLSRITDALNNNSTADTDGHSLGIEDTRVVAASLSWATANPGSLAPLATSHEQLEAGRQMIAQFVGPAAAKPST